MKKINNHYTESTVGKIWIIGFVGGILWSFVWYIGYVFHFTEVGPNMLLLLFPFGGWKSQVVGQYVGIFTFGCLSIGVAFFYYFFFKKFLGILPGIIFGIVIWGGLSIVLPAVNYHAISMMDVCHQTITTNVCIAILYGVFISYSVSYADYSNK